MLQNKVLNKYKTKLQVWKHGTYCRYFYLNLKFLGWPYREYMKIAEMAAKYFLCGDDLDPVLAIFLSDGYGANQTHLRELRRSLQMKKIAANAPCAL